MNRTLKAFSLLLSYPEAELQAAIPAIREALGTKIARNLEPLLNSLETDDIYDLQERFVLLFDRSRTLSLNLFEHVHGESRDRGPAMVDLLETYRAGGFEPTSPELPDHLPLLLEFLANQPDDVAHEILDDTAHILEALRVRLTRRESLYAPVFTSLMALAKVKPDAEALAGLLEEPEEDPTDLEALDKVWEEAAVTFGPDPNAGCPATRDMLGRMDLPQNPAPKNPAPAAKPALNGASNA